MQIGNRIIFDQDGEVIVQLGEMQGELLPRKNPLQLDYIDLEYGQLNYTKYRIVAIDTETKQPILEEIIIPKTEEQLRIEALENELLKVSGVI